MSYNSHSLLVTYWIQKSTRTQIFPYTHSLHQNLLSSSFISENFYFYFSFFFFSFLLLSLPSLPRLFLFSLLFLLLLFLFSLFHSQISFSYDFGFTNSVPGFIFQSPSSLPTFPPFSSFLFSLIFDVCLYSLATGRFLPGILYGGNWLEELVKRVLKLEIAILLNVVFQGFLLSLVNVKYSFLVVVQIVVDFGGLH